MNSRKLSKGFPESQKSINRFRWFMVLLLLFGAIINYFDRTNISIANVVIADEFGLGEAKMGVLLSAFAWPYAIVSLLSGWAVDKKGPKKILTWAIAFWSLVTVISGFANGFIFMLLARILLGASESPYFVAGVKVTNRWFPKEKRGFPTSVFNMGPTIAQAIAPPILTAVMLFAGWRIMFISIGALGFIFVIFWIIFYKDPKPENDYEISAIEEESKDENSSNLTWSSLFKFRSTWGMIIGAFGTNFTLWVFLTWLPGYLSKGRGLDLMTTGWASSIPFIAGIFGVPIGGLLADYLIKKGVAPIKARKFPIVGAAILSAISVIPVPYVSSTVLAIVFLSIGFFASSIPPSVMWTLSTDVAPKDKVGSLAGIQNFGGFLGGAAAPMVTGVVVQTTSSFQMVFLIGAILLIISAFSYGYILKNPIRVQG